MNNNDNNKDNNKDNSMIKCNRFKSIQTQSTSEYPQTNKNNINIKYNNHNIN